jgi:hypothetical protein
VPVPVASDASEVWKFSAPSVKRARNPVFDTKAFASVTLAICRVNVHV